MQKRFPWGVSILFGGGFALAEAAEKSGLSTYIGGQLSGLYKRKTIIFFTDVAP